MEKVAVYYVKKVDEEHSNMSSIQLDKIDRWCNENNYKYALFVDEVKSRLDIENRESLDLLKEFVSKGVYSNIIIYNLPNISRNTKFNLDLISFAEDNNCRITSMDGFNSHKYFEFMRKILNEKKEEFER